MEPERYTAAFSVAIRPSLFEFIENDREMKGLSRRQWTDRALTIAIAIIKKRASEGPGSTS